MKHTLLSCLLLVLVGWQAQAQTTPSKAENERNKKALEQKLLKNRANDHFIFQIGYDGWASKPDSIRTTGMGTHINAYAMYDMPFKTNPKMSAAIGAGVGSSNIYFDKQIVEIAPTTSRTRVEFRDVADTFHYKKFKQTNIWLELPVEFRYVANPFNTNKSFKFAIGAKLGTMISAYTRGKNYQSKDGQSVYGEKYSVKEKQRSFYNSTRLAATARVGYGPFTVYGAYQVTNLFKEIAGPPVRPFSIGLSISGL